MEMVRDESVDPDRTTTASETVTRIRSIPLGSWPLGPADPPYWVEAVTQGASMSAGQVQCTRGWAIPPK